MSRIPLHLKTCFNGCTHFTTHHDPHLHRQGILSMASTAPKFEFLREERKCKGLFASSPLRARSVNPRSRRPPNSSCSPYTRTTTMSLKPSSRHRAIGLYKEVRPPAVPEQRKGRNWCLLADACFILSHPFLPSLTVTAAATRTGLVGPAELSLPHDTG